MADSPATNNQLTPVQKAVINMQQDVIKFATKMLGEEKAKEFATRISLMNRKDPKIGEAIIKTPESFLTAYMACVERDIMPNTSQGLAYIIPYGNEVQFQMGYKGLLLEARRTGEVLTIDAENVFKGDKFKQTLGTNRELIHEPADDVDRTDYDAITHTYATAKLKNGEHPFVVVTKKELDKIRNKAQSKGGPWKDWPERQAIKTAYKRLSKVLPSERMARAAYLDDLAEAGKLRFDRTHGEFIETEISTDPNFNATADRKSSIIDAHKTAENKWDAAQRDSGVAPADASTDATDDEMAAIEAATKKAQGK